MTWRRGRAGNLSPEKSLLNLIGLTIGLLASSIASGHAMPVAQNPAAGEVLTESPSSVVIDFDRVLETAFSRLRVDDAEGLRVDRDDAHVIETKPHRLVVSLSPLEPGLYHVMWSAASRDGHITHGDYEFSVN